MAIEVRRGGEFLRAKSRWWKRILFRRARIWAAGAVGEALVRHELERLPDRFLLLHDVVHGRDGANLDHVVVGPRGVVAIETKYYHAEVRGKEDGDDWRRRPVRHGFSRFLGGGWQPIPDPTQQVRRGATKIEAYLATIPELGPLSDAAQLRVTPLVVFAHPKGRIRVRGRTVRIVSLRHLRRFVKRAGKHNISARERHAVATALMSWRPRDT